MKDTTVVVVKIAAMFLVILLGYAARRRAHVDAATTSRLGAFTADVCLPALTFTQLYATVDASSLRRGALVPLLGAGVILLGQLAGKLFARIFSPSRQVPTFVFLGAMANWIYLPLPIVQALHGQAGVEVLLLMNVGAQIVLWTVGVMTLRGGKLGADALVGLARNPGLGATFAGVAAALILPPGALGSTVWANAGSAILEAIGLIGTLTIPASLLVTGAQLGELPLVSRPSRGTFGVLLVRLVVTPAAALGVAWAAARGGAPLPPLQAAITVLVAAMPVAVSCSILTARYEQDTWLAAQSIFYSTALSVVTVPAVSWIYSRIMP